MGYALTVTPFSRGLMTARDFLLPIAIFAVTLSVPFLWVLWGYIVLGQAHFVMTYIYQARGKKMTRGYLLLAGALAIAAAAYFTLSGAFIPLVIAVSILFATHFALDELTLHDSPWNIPSLITVALFASLFFTFVLSDLFPSYAMLSGIAVLLCVLYVVIRSWSGPTPSDGERYLWYVAVFVAVLSYTLPAFSALNILACVIWLHTINWAIGYGIRLRGKGNEEPRYWLLTALTFFGALGGWALFQFGQVAWLGAFFAPGPYYAWAIAHILLSFYISSFAHTKQR